MVLAALQEAGRPRADVPVLPREEYHSHFFEALGTTCRILFAADRLADADAFVRIVTAWVRGYEARYSRFVPESLISQINANAGKNWVEVDDELRSLFALCDWFHWHTQGIFDPTSLPLARLWDHRVEHAALPTPAAIEEARRLVGWRKLEREGTRVRLPDEGMALDLGGIGKEYAVDRVVEMAAERGIEDILVDFGRDIRVCGQPPEGDAWRIGFEDPTDTGRCWAGAALRGRAIATSGDYARKFELNGRRYGHILDLRTGHPVANGCRAVTVIAPTCTEAGILAKTVFVLGTEEGLRYLARCHQAEGCIWADQGRFQSPGLVRYLIRRKPQRAGERP